MKRFFSVSFLIGAFLFPSITLAYTTNMNASVVVGQSSFSGSSINAGGSVDKFGYDFPQGLTSDGTKLIVSDCGNHRLLIYNTIPTTNGVGADIVTGQTNFTNHSANAGGSPSAFTMSCPEGLTIKLNKLMLADYANSRILVYNAIPTANNTAASVELGQPNFTTNGDKSGPSGISGPSGADYDPITGRFFITDFGNHRILGYNSLPTVSGAAADFVIGQTDLNSNTSGTSATKLIYPYPAKVFGTKMVVAEANNARVLIYNSVPSATNTAADVVIGQQNFNVNQENEGGSPNARTLRIPTDTAFDGIRFFVLDEGNSRILVYDGIPTANYTAALIAIGQPNLTSNSANQGGSPAANTLSSYLDTGLTATNTQLFVSDSNNNRVLIYNNVTTPLTGTVSKETAIDSALFRWTTTTATTSFVRYGTTSAYDSSSTLYDRNPRVTTHSVRLTGLASCTTFHYQVVSTDSNLQDQVSTDDTFTTDCYPNTNRAPDTGIHGPPACNSEKPGSAPNLFQITTQGTSATLYIAPGSMPYNKFFIAYGQGTVTEQYGVEFESNFSGGVLPFTINSLAKNTKYSFKVRAGNGCQTGDWSSALSATTTSSANTKRIFTPFSK